MMAVAYWQFHFPSGNWPIQNQGMPAVLFCFIFLYMAANGAGYWSLDELIITFVCLILAFIFFLLSAFGVKATVKWQDLGFAFVVLAVIFR